MYRYLYTFTAKEASKIVEKSTKRLLEFLNSLQNKKKSDMPTLFQFYEYFKNIYSFDEDCDQDINQTRKCVSDILFTRLFIYSRKRGIIAERQDRQSKKYIGPLVLCLHATRKISRF